MPNCPHCGEPYRIGQDKCYACGHTVRGRRSAGKKKPINPLIFIAAGVVVVIVAVALLVSLPRNEDKTEEAARKAEQERVADSVRKANRAKRMETVEYKEAERYRKEIGQLQFRFDRIVEQTVGESPTGAQQRLMSQIRAGISQLLAMADRIATLPEKERKKEANVLRDEQRRIRSLISDLSRAPKGGS